MAAFCQPCTLQFHRAIHCDVHRMVFQKMFITQNHKNCFKNISSNAILEKFKWCEVMKYAYFKNF